MQILRFFAICFIICGYVGPIYADGLTANPWGKGNAANTPETAAQPPAPLKANPWKDPKSSHLVHFSDSADETPDAPQATPHMVVSARPRMASGTMSRTKSPIKIISRSELNGGYNTFVNPNNDKDFSAMWNGLFSGNNNTTPTFSGGSNADFDILPDFGKIKRDSVRKFNNATAPVRQMGSEAKDYFEKGSGINLDNLF
jgi:hypothetical protein